MRNRLGESLASEWRHDADGDRIWDALRLIERGLNQGIYDLLSLAEGGSSLAMMYAGDIYLHGKYGLNKDINKGLIFLRESFERGSTSAGDILANFLMVEGSVGEGLRVYKELAGSGYPPAHYALGYHYLFGDAELRDVRKGVCYFKSGARIGHVPSMNEYANHILRNNPSWISVLWAACIKIRFSFSKFYLYAIYPDSDRLKC